MSRCLSCHQPLPESDGPAYHPVCSRKLFGKAVPPAFPYTEAELLALAEAVVRQHIAVTGVQPKLSLSVAPAGTAGQPDSRSASPSWARSTGNTSSSRPPPATPTCPKQRLSERGRLPHSLRPDRFARPKVNVLLRAYARHRPLARRRRDRSGFRLP